MDRIDRKILNFLQTDAAQTNSKLAERVALSPSSCLRRVQRLKADGIIDRIVAILNPAKAGRGLKAIVTVELREHGEQKLREFLNAAIDVEAVTQAYAVTGDIDALLHMRLKDMEEFDALCDRLFRGDTNVVRFHSLIVIRTAKEETAIAV